MTRVAIVIDSLWIGGAQRLIATFAASASAYDITPIVVSLQDDNPSVILDSIRSAGVRALTVPSQSIFNLKRLRWLIKFFGDEGIDVVQTHLLYANILGTIAAHIAKIPVIATLHSTHVDKGWRISLLRQMENYILRHYATRILAVGNKVAVANQSFYGGRKVDVIPNGIPAPEAISLQARNQIRHDIAGDETRSIIITVGRFSTAKAYEDMIEAFDLLRQKDQKPLLLMVGKGSTVDSVKAKINSLRLDQSVILAGERHDVPQLLASSDVYASSSHREGLPLAVLEAMMAGLPIVATSVGDIPNVVTEDTGVIVPPRNPAMLAAALEKLLGDPQRMLAMGKAARKRALTEYSVDVWMRRHVALYMDVLKFHGNKGMQ